MTRTAIVTDSASALDTELAGRFGVYVAPMTVTVEGETAPETETVPDWFYARLAAGAEVITSQPSPGVLLDMYRQAERDGAERIWSIHISAGMSGTLNAARVAAEMAPLPVTVIDSGTTSMPEGLVVLAAAAAAENGASQPAPAIAAELESQENLFVTMTAERIRASGRVKMDGVDAENVVVLSLRSGVLEPLGSAPDIGAAIQLMARRAAESGTPVIAVGDGGMARSGDDLAEMIRADAPGAMLLRYKVPPSVGAHAGFTVGLVLSRAPIARLGDLGRPGMVLSDSLSLRADGGAPSSRLAPRSRIRSRGHGDS